ncbi:hypothetical protein PGB90_003756 [Kerria lacca]
MGRFISMVEITQILHNKTAFSVCGETERESSFSLSSQIELNSRRLTGHNPVCLKFFLIVEGMKTDS